jgi:transposase
MSGKKPEIIKVDAEQLEGVVRRAQEGSLTEQDTVVIQQVFNSYAYFTDLVEHKNTSIRRLRELLFGVSTEKTSQITGQTADGEDTNDAASASDETTDDKQPQDGPSDSDSPAPEPNSKGHGRNSADAYPGAQRIELSLESLEPGDPCPECQQGLVYEKSPAVVIRITGQAPLHATRYEQQRLRCNLCGKTFTAPLPETAGDQKYDAKSASMIALLKYGSGLPFNRLERLQRDLEIPLPASTQWDVVNGFAPAVTPAFDELIRQAAAGDVLHNDDTTTRILELMGQRRQELDDESKPERKGMYTSGVVSTTDGHRMALFFSGHQHAGENLADVLKHRADELDQPIQMCDALSRNLPGELKTIVANCLAHARRRFVQAHDRFPDECVYVLEELQTVYRNDTVARERGLSAEQRLRFHRGHSRQPMKRLHKWMTQQLDKKQVEPNSALGEAIGYMLKHWEKLTQFLKQAGAPLDNNIAERALKRAILHRKNALFFRTRHGARVGDLYLSLIHTCDLNEANPFEYLTAVIEHADEVAATPACWMPWNYRAAIEQHQAAA